MLINAQNLAALEVGFNDIYQQAFDGVEPDHNLIAMTAPSDGTEEVYGWLGQLEGVREWLDERQIRNLEAYDFAIKNKDWELTYAVLRNHMLDDKIGKYRPLFGRMGEAAARHPSKITWPLLAAGFTGKCYDGKMFFSATHPGYTAKGKSTSVSNLQTGEGNGWYLLDLSSDYMKPLIYQPRAPFQTVSLAAPTDENVFMRKRYIYGIDGRDNAGYGLWQYAFGSKADLDATNYALAKAALEGQYTKSGDPLGAQATHLVYHSSLEADAKKLIAAINNADGSSNIWYQDVMLYKARWLPPAA